jgi:hypothetical protein
LVIGQSNPALSISTGITLGPVRSLALRALAFARLGFDEAFGGEPMPVGLAFGAPVLDPQEISDLADSFFTVGHVYPRL